MEEQYTFALGALLKYTVKGDFVETGAIIFDPPSMDSFNESVDFEQLIMKSMMSAAKNSDSEGESEEGAEMKIPTASEMRLVLHTGTVSIREIARAFRKLACKTGWLDEKTRIKDSHFDKLSKNDFMDMMCGYASFFTFPSLLRGD